MSGPIRLHVGALAVLLALGLCNCSTDGLPNAPSNCETSKPSSGNLNIQVTVNAQNPRVPVDVYVGPIEDGQFVIRDTVSVSQVTYVLSVDHSYAVTARYLVGQDTVLAIAQDNIGANQVEYSNSDYCWELKNANADVRLKL